MSQLQSTEFLDIDSPVVAAFAQRVVAGQNTSRERAVALYYAVRDSIRYDVYGVDLSRAGMRASTILERKVGFCIHKSLVFAALARHVGIPSRLGYSDVRNHLSTPRLRRLVGGDVFRYHAHAEVWLDGHWIRVAPVFNATLCKLFGVEPLAFDGYHDAVRQTFDAAGERALETLCNHGTFDDFPYDQCIGALRESHPRLFETDQRTHVGNLAREHDASDRKEV